MRKFISKIILLALAFGFFVGAIPNSMAAEDIPEYVNYRTIDLGTFDEYRHKITKEFFVLRDEFEVDGVMSNSVLLKIENLAKEGLNYLPDSLVNDNLKNRLVTAINRAKNNRNSEAYYRDVVKKIGEYLDKASIKKLKGRLITTPQEGNAPLNVTFRALFSDPEGTIIPKYNYVWWMDVGGRKKILGSGTSLNYTFEEEGKYTMFIDVKSNHKNRKGFTDVLPLRLKSVVTVKEKVASLIVKVNGNSLRFVDELKFTPEQGRYGLLFDATSSIPSGGATFVETSWDFGNGIEKKYSGEPRIERVIYNKEGTYDVELKIRTNLGGTVTKKFKISIHDPIASIVVSPTQGYLGDKFTFSAKSSGDDDGFTYSWEIVDAIKDEVIFKKQAKLFTYSFTKKGHFNIKLKTSYVTSDDYDVDTKIIYINSRAPVANFKYSAPKKNKPNRILLDATDSYDPDYSDDGKLKYSWVIDGNRVDLEDANANGSLGYYTFSSIGDHSVVLEVTDPDGIKGVKDLKVKVNSILSVEFSPFPRAIKAGQSIKFKATSPQAKIFEWNFGDGQTKKQGTIKSTITHKYEKSGIYTVILKVIDKDSNTNTYSSTIYVGDAISPMAIIRLKKSNGESPALEKGVCGGKDAFIVDRATTVAFDGSESIDVNGQNTGLDYSLKIGNSKYYPSKIVNYKFDELGCFPVKLTVVSQTNKKSSTKSIWVKVENLKPTLDGLTTNIVNPDTDPIVVDVTAIGAKDEDGVITSYIWYYYTDVDPEPQDFRATTKPATKFVLPKITGNYYFVVVLMDDNEARVSSQDLSRVATITLAGDNINVPLVDLNVSDTSVYMNEDVVFTAQVKNILGKNISSGAKYYWDFDGDGFYDKETSKNTTSHKYKKSGEFFAKLKVKYKGFSNVRVVTINVANKLEPNFDYISIGNKFIFIDKSSGSYTDISWELGDGEKVEGRKSFIYDYTDGKSSHKVKLIISEGKIVKKIEKTVVKNVKNLIKSKKKGFHIFSSPPLGEDGNITIDKQIDSVSIYLGANTGNIAKYVIDTDVNIDSDLNGGKDDDEDLHNTNGNILVVPLNNSAVQTIRASIYDEDGIIIEDSEITITKTYIEETEVDPNSIVFEGVSDSEKQRIEELKVLLTNVPQEYRVKSMVYLQKLKEEWTDDTEKTKVILEFEGYLDETNILNKNEIIDTLEALLLEQGEELTEKEVAFNALSNLIPKEMTCDYDTKEYASCKESLVAKLEAIKVSSDVELSKTLGTEILEAIKPYPDMGAQEKLDFKAILQNLIYGSLENIPEEDIPEGVSVTKGEPNVFMGILKTLIYIILGVLGVVLVIVLGYYIYYKLVSKDENQSFGDFVLDKTKHKPSDEDKQEDLDIFSGESLSDEKEQKNTPSDDILSQGVETTVTKEETKQDTASKETPSWLKGVETSVGETPKAKTENSVSSSDDFVGDNTKNDVAKIDLKQEVSNEATKDEAPDWLKETKQKEKTNESKKDEITTKKAKPFAGRKQEKPLEEQDLDEITKIEDDSSVPDWLKGSLYEGDSKKPKEEKKDEKILKQIKQDSKKDEEEKLKATDSKIVDKQETKDSKQDENVPDWLKGSFEEVDTKQGEDLKAKAEKTSKKEESVAKKTTKTKVVTAKKDETKKKQTKKQTPTKQVKKASTQKQKDDKKQNKEVKDTKSETKNSKQELWDNGMDVPDWLKVDDK